MSLHSIRLFFRLHRSPAVSKLDGGLALALEQRELPVSIN
jgi:hypothetical protein